MKVSIPSLLTLRVLVAAAFALILGALPAAAQTHPRLFFGPDDVPGLRAKAQTAPFNEMLARMIQNIHSVDYNQRGGNFAAAYLLTGNETYARMAALRAIDYFSNTDRWANDTAWGLRRGIDMMAMAHLVDFCYNSTTWANFVVPATLEPESFVINGVTTYIPGTGANKTADNIWHTSYTPRTVTVPSQYVGLPLRQAVSLALKLNADSLMASGGGSWPGNDKTGNNWWAVRYASAALGYLLCNETGVTNQMNEAISRLKTHLSANLGDSPAGMGWNPEGIAYAQFPGWFTYPFAIALKRNTGRDLVAEHPAMRYALWSTYMGLVPVQRNSRLGAGLGIRPDFDDDHNVWEGEGTGALAFAFAYNDNPNDAIPDFDYRPGIKYLFRRVAGDLGDRQWDSASGNGIYAFLYYPHDIPEQNPDTVWGRTYYDPTYGAVMFRSGHQDADFSPFSGGLFTTNSTDIVFQTTANLRSELGGHGGPDDLTFRLIGLGVPWAVGSGRVWDVKGQTALFPYDPETSAANPATMWDTAVLDIFQRKNAGDGYVVLRADTTSTGVSNLRRRMITDFSGRSGAPGFFIVSDSCNNPCPWWRQQTISTNTIDVSTPGQFVITSPEGHRLLGKILHPANAQARTGTFQRGNEYFYKTQNLTQNKWVDFQGDMDGNVLVALAVVPAGQPLPAINVSGSPSAGFTVTSGNATFQLEGDTITSPDWNPPAVAITSPATGAAFVFPSGNATVAVSGNASDSNGNVVKIEVLLNDELRHTLNFNAPNVSWGPVNLTGLALGNHTIKAIATDNSGDTRTATTTVRITRSLPPAVEITHPSAASPLLAGQNLVIRGRATDPDDPLDRVEVWFESANQSPTLQKLGNATLQTSNGTWSYNWNNLPVGRGTLYAVAYDNSGESTSTATIPIKGSLPFANDPLAGDAGNYSVIRGVGANHRWSVANDNGNLALRGRPLTNNDYNNYRTFLEDSNIQRFPDFEVTWRAKMITPLAENPQYFLNFGSEMFLDLQTINGVEKPNPWTNANKGTRVWLQTPSYRTEVAWGENLHRTTDPGYPDNPGTDRAGVPDNNWNNLKARRVGKNLQVWVNDVLVLNGTDNTIGTRGRVGFGSERNSGSEVLIDDVVFTPLNPDGSPAADQPAALAFTAPADLAQVVIGQAVTLSGTASDPDGLASLALYRGSVKVADLPATGSWSHTWNSPQAGFYSFHLESTDNRGFVSRSAPLRVTVASTAGGATNQPPAVTIGQNGGVQPPSFGLIGSANDPDGSIAAVQIFRNGAFIGPATISGSTWNYTVTGMATGSYTFTARAIDNLGATTEASFIGVVDGNAPPSISSIQNQTINQGQSAGPLAFTVADDTTPAADLVVTAASSNQALVTDGSITLGGSGSNRTVSITPVPSASGTTVITLTVSDGAKTASTTFVLAVNGPPVPTSVAVTPASATMLPGGTQQFTATLLDQYGAPVSPQPSFSWSVSGGGTIDSNGLFTAGSSFGNFQITATGGGFAGTARADISGGISIVVPVVRWSGNYVTSTQGFSRSSTTGTADLDGDGQADDAFRTIPFNTSTPLNPSANYNTAAPSAVFYGGASTGNFNSTSPISFSDAFVVNSADADYFGFRAQAASRASAAYVWLKPGFLNGASDAGAKVVFSRNSRMTLEVGNSKWENVGAARWLVRQDGQWYVSQAALPSGTGNKTLTFSADFDDGNWAPVDLAGAPHVNLNLDALTYAQIDFTDIDAFGVYIEADALNGNRFWTYIREFKVEASAVSDPVPTTLEITPASATLAPGASQQFSATLRDQYGVPVNPQPAITWSVSGGGVVDSTGRFTASFTPGGPHTLTATAGEFTANASITVDSAQSGTPPIVTYAGAAGVEEFKDVFELSDGTVLVAGSAENLDWLSAPKTQLAPLSIPNRSTGRTAFLMRLSADLQSVLGVWHLPAGQALDFRWIKSTSLPGEPTGAIYLSGSCDATSGDYFIARLDDNFLGGDPSGFSWVLLAKATNTHGDNLGLHPWDVGADGRVAYLDETGGVLRIFFANASGQPLKLDGLRGSHWPAGAPLDDANRLAGVGADFPAAARSGISFPADLRSWTDADRLAILPDGNGQIKRGSWPLDLFTPVQDRDGGTSGAIEYGYTGYRSAGKFRVGGVAYDRTSGAFFVGFNIQSRFWDAPANIEQPDFEPAVIAYAADGSLLWWSRLYHEVVDSNNNGQIDPGETRLSSPDQYVDGLALDYSTSPARVVVLARCHGNNQQNLWRGNAVAANPGGNGFQNQFTGTEGNIHLGWVGKLRATDGQLQRATYLSGYFRHTTLTQSAYSDPNLDGWPSHNAGWPNLTTTRAETGSLRVDSTGHVYVVGIGPRMVTTATAYQKLPKITNSVNEGISPWAAFARVFDSDLVTLTYSTALTGAWTYPEPGAQPEGADNTDLFGIHPTSSGLLTVGRHRATNGVPDGNPVPFSEAPAWGDTMPRGVSALFARLPFNPATAASTAPVIVDGPRPASEPITGVSATLIASAADPDDHADSLTYTWSVVSAPPGGAVSFSPNGANAASATTATFTRAGTYQIKVVAADPGGKSGQATLPVYVSATPTAVAVSPASDSVNAGTTRQFTASLTDQFGQPISGQTFTWSVSGGGVISSSGLFTAGATAGGPHTITAALGGLSATAQVTVTIPQVPDIDLSHASITQAAQTGSSTTRPLRIRNLGPAGLNWTATAAIQGGGGGGGNFTSFTTSSQTGGPTFQWHDISANGTAVFSGTQDDSTAKITFPAGFTFPFYGNTFSEVHVCSNGFLNFGTTGSTSFAVYKFPNSNLPANSIGVLMNDLVVDSSASVLWKQLDANRIVISWINVMRWGSSGTRATFQVILNSNGEILLQYLHMGLSGNMYSIGVQDGTKTKGLSVSYQTTLVPVGNNINFAIRLVPSSSIPAWLSVAPASGSAAQGVSNELTLGFSTTGLAAGSYNGTVTIQSNDPDEATLQVPVTLQVNSSPVTPNAPSGLSATALSGSEVGLTWNLEGGSPTGHRADYREAGVGTWSAGPVFSANATSGSIPGLSPGKNYEFRVVAFNAAGDSPSSNLATASTPGGYASWIAAQSGVGTLTAPLADPDSDGIPNLLEYALGSLPGDASSSALPELGQSANHLTLSFTPATTQGLRYIIEASSDLSDWSDQSDITALLQEGQPYRHTDPADLATTPRRFLRLRVVTEP